MSLEVEEGSIDGNPKLNEDGSLHQEEVVRRTSSSLNESNILIGSKEKGGKEIRISVRKIFRIYNEKFGSVLIEHVFS